MKNRNEKCNVNRPVAVVVVDRHRSGLDDGYGLGLLAEPCRTSADHLVRRIVGQRVPQRRPGRSRRRFVRLHGHRYPGDGQHVLLAVRAHERLDRPAAGATDAATVVRAGDAATARGAATADDAAAFHLAPLLHHGVQVAGRVRPALAAQRVAAAAGRHRAAAARVCAGCQVYA